MRRLALVVALGLAMACSDPNQLPNATQANAVDTVTLWALSTASLRNPGAYSLVDRAAVRTYETIAFEFAFDLSPAREPRLLPLAVLGLSPGNELKPGLLRSALGFDEMLRAPLNGYVTADTVPVQPGDRFFLRSRPVCTTLGGVPQYGKLEVLAVDPVAETLQFRVVANNNCGYRSLALGVPKN